MSDFQVMSDYRMYELSKKWYLSYEEITDKMRSMGKSIWKLVIFAQGLN
jgi:hypothetical protein